MKRRKMLSILVFVLAPVLASNVHGKIILTVNNQDVSSITLDVGQSCTVEVASSDSVPYEAYVGFYKAPVIGDFSPLEIKPEAGKGAEVLRYSTPDFRGYHVKTGSGIIIPSPGVHFVFRFEAQEVGETDIKLFDETLKTELDSIHITVIPVAMGTVFTYQGRLIHDNNPTDGLYDFEFKLYDSPAGGNQLASTIDINDLDVIEGYFTVELDFNDPNVFNGDACWLDISVRPGDGSSFTTLSPRQQLTPAPYAVYAENAGADSDWMVSGDNLYSIPSGRVGIGTTSPSSKLHIEEDKPGSATVTIHNKNDSGSERLHFGTDPDIDAGILVFGSNNSTYPGKWQFFNNKTSANFDWLTNGSTKMTLSNNGNLGIGTTSPESSLHIKSQQPEVRFEESDQSDKKWHIAGYNSGLLFAETGEGDAMYIEQGGQVGIGTTSPAERLDVSGNVTASKYYDRDNPSYYLDPSSTLYSAKFAGDVGIGTTTPESKLHIRSSSPEVRLEESDQSDKKWSIVGRNSGLSFAETGEGYTMHIKPGGNVGIGTTNPGAKLEVDGDLKVTGAYKGNISSSSGSDGAPFPRPAYDSGWQEVLPGLSVELQHNIGGDPNNYVVDMQFKGGGILGVNQALYGGDVAVDGTGAFWFGLTDTEIFVHRQPYNVTAEDIRVRIWVYN